MSMTWKTNETESLDAKTHNQMVMEQMVRFAKSHDCQNNPVCKELLAGGQLSSVWGPESAFPTDRVQERMVEWGLERVYDLQVD